MSRTGTAPGAPPGRSPTPGEALEGPDRRDPLWLLAPVLLLLIPVIVFEAAGIHAVREWSMLVSVFNALFCAAPAFIIGLVAARDYLVSGSAFLLGFGPGAIVLGFGYLVAALLGDNLDLSVSVLDLGILVASILFAASALSALRGRDVQGGGAGRVMGLVLVYVGTLVIVAVIVLLATLDIIPDFYSAGGVTMARQLVLSLAVVLLLDRCWMPHLSLGADGWTGSCSCAARRSPS